MNQPKITKKIRLALWWLLYRVPLVVDIQNDALWRIEAGEHLKLDQDGLRAIEEVYPRHWTRMLDKRARRAAYAQEHDGCCPDGWTPPLPGEPVRNPPWMALAKRHPFGILGVVSQYPEARMLNSIERYRRLREATLDTASRARARGR